MAISSVWIEGGCISCGLAEAICPEVFKLPANSPNTVKSVSVAASPSPSNKDEGPTEV